MTEQELREMEILRANSLLHTKQIELLQRELADLIGYKLATDKGYLVEED